MAKMKEIAFELDRQQDILTDAQLKEAMRIYYDEKDAELEKAMMKAKKYDKLVALLQRLALYGAALGFGSILMRVIV